MATPSSHPLMDFPWFSRFQKASKTIQLLGHPHFRKPPYKVVPDTIWPPATGRWASPAASARLSPGSEWKSVCVYIYIYVSYHIIHVQVLWTLMKIVYSKFAPVKCDSLLIFHCDQESDFASYWPMEQYGTILIPVNTVVEDMLALRFSRVKHVAQPWSK